MILGSHRKEGIAMLSKDILEAQETVELPAREMMDANFSLISAWQGNLALQGSFAGSANLSGQGNLIAVSQNN